MENKIKKIKGFIKRNWWRMLIQIFFFVTLVKGASIFVLGLVRLLINQENLVTFLNLVPDYHTTFDIICFGLFLQIIMFFIILGVPFLFYRFLASLIGEIE